MLHCLAMLYLTDHMYYLRGQIGDGTHNKRYEPYAVKGMTNITQIAAGNNHIVALDANGNVWRWGDNSYGQFGNGSTVSSNSPINNYYGDLEHKNISSGSVINNCIICI